MKLEFTLDEIAVIAAQILTKYPDKRCFAFYAEMGSGKTHYTYQNNNVSEKSSSFEWVDFVYAQDAQWNNRLSFQIQNIEQVKKYLTEMKALGFYFSNKKVVDRQIFEVYSDGVNTIELITSQNRNANDNNMYFNFAFYSADEYQYAFSNENKRDVNEEALTSASRSSGERMNPLPASTAPW